MTLPFLPLGKLPAHLLQQVLARAPIQDPRVMLGPGIGIDCAVIDTGPSLLVFKAEPITFVTSEIGWYAVQISINDIATTGAQPRWFMTTLLLPERRTTQKMVFEINDQVYNACKKLGISVIGGHTEITHGLDRPLLVGTMIGEVAHERLVTPRGASPGDRVLLTKGIPIEATAILAREFPDRLRGVIGNPALEQAANYLYDPGISVLKEAQIAVDTGGVSAMHDPTEGGLAAALWELATASQHTLRIDPGKVPVPELSRKICQFFNLDPFATIASGALLLTVRPEFADKVRQALEEEEITCAEIGRVEDGPVAVWNGFGPDAKKINQPDRDEITRVFE